VNVDVKRFKEYVAFLDDSDDSCWIWTGSLTDDGRGRFRVGKKHVKAHRIAWELLHGEPIPDGLRLRQECNQPQCIRHWRLDRPWKRLSDEQVRQIRAANGPSYALAVTYETTSNYIRQIRCGASRVSAVMGTERTIQNGNGRRLA
jgi:hypothetical protein